MNNRELHIKLINEQFSRIEIQVRNLNSQNLCDLNIVCENLICGLLNLTFGYNLININSKEQNYPGVDLVDYKKRISVQVSSDKSKAKIQKTLDTFSQQQLASEFDRLIFFILGESQKKYSNLIVPANLSFNINGDIIDFKSLLKFISYLPIGKIEQINNYLNTELSSSKDKRQSAISRTAFKQKLTLKKKIEKELILDSTKEEWVKYSNMLSYDPSRKFKYSHLIIRSFDDKSYPETTFNAQEMPSWMKGELWDFYDNGLEFVMMSSKKVIIDEDGTWSFCDDNQNSIRCSWFFRIPYDNMVEYEKETDGYYGYPTLFVEYKNNGSPIEKELYGLLGFYDSEKPENSRMTYYLDEEDQK